MTKRVNLMLFRPDHPRFAILDSYREVIESLQWGFQALGWECTMRTNVIDQGCLNIVFGWIVAFQFVGPDQFPPGTILFNMEQYGLGMQGNLNLELAASRYQIWEYAPANMRHWPSMSPRFPVYYAPISYAPNLRKFPQAPADIDISYTGSLNLARAQKLIDCVSGANRPSFVCMTGVWGATRDALLARSKLILNVSGDVPGLTIFEIVRVSYYLANRKAVVCEAKPGLEIEPDMAAVLRFVPADALAETCAELLADDAKRQAYADACFEAFAQRDVRKVISGFFGA